MMIVGEPVKSSLRTALDFVLDHPKTAGFLAAIALAISLSPRASAMGSWISLFAAFLFAVAMVSGFREKYRLHWAWVGLMGVAVLVTLGTLGWWLTTAKEETHAAVSTDALEKLEKMRQHTHIEFWQPDAYPIPANNPDHREQLTFHYHVGEIPSVNLGIDNVGDFPVLPKSTIDARLVMLPKEQVGNNLRIEFDSGQTARCHELAPFQRRTSATDSCWRTYDFDRTLTKDDVKALKKADAMFCVVGVAKWKDESGKYKTDLYKCEINGNWRGAPPFDEREMPVGN